MSLSGIWAEFNGVAALKAMLLGIQWCEIPSDH
jgi:hypothetical protein